MDSVADEVLRLRFTGRHVESMYRNDDRIRELFIGRIGSIARFGRSASREANGSLGFKGIAELAGTKGGEQSVEYDLTDPTAQALVLRENLAVDGLLRTVDEATRGDYVSVAGASCLSRPPDQPVAFDFHAACHVAGQPAYADLEHERAMQEAMSRAMTPGDEQLWLLAISDHDEQIVCAAVLLRHWINQNAFMSYMHMPWEVFGTVRDRIHGVPVLAAMHVVARLDLTGNY